MTANNELVPGFDDVSRDSLKIRLQKISERCMVVYPSGDVDTSNSPFFQKKVVKVIEAGFTRLVFSLAGVGYISSTGIGAFTAFLKTVKLLNGDIVLLEIHPNVFEVFQLLGFSQFFTVKENLNDAVSFLEGRDSGVKRQAFPRIFTCPICSKRLKASKAGRFRCIECKTILVVDDESRIYLG